MEAATIMKTSEVADRAGVNLQTVRYYERRGLIPEPPRSDAGYRQYDADDVARIRFIKRAQELGFSLDEIEALLSLRAESGTSSRHVKRHAEAKIADIEEKIRDLERMKRTLEELAERCTGEGSVADCPILHAIDSAAS